MTNTEISLSGPITVIIQPRESAATAFLPQLGVEYDGGAARSTIVMLMTLGLASYG